MKFEKGGAFSGIDRALDPAPSSRGAHPTQNAGVQKTCCELGFD